MWTNAKVKVTYADGSTETRPLGYKMLMSTETKVGNNASAAGVIYDMNMTPIPDPTGKGKPVTFETPDGTMLANIARQDLSPVELRIQLDAGRRQRFQPAHGPDPALVGDADRAHPVG